MRFIIGAFVGLALFLLIRSLIDPSSSTRETASVGPTVRSTPTQMVSSEERRTAPTIPPDQAQFLEAVAQGKEAHRAAGSDKFAQGAARPARRQAICQTAAGQTLRVSGWVGQVATRSTNSEGKGVLSIQVAPDVFLTTYNNAFSDIRFRTLIEPGTQVFNEMANLRTGDWVIFSGRFFANPTDCVEETSLTLRGSMTSPEFLFQFLEIHRAP